MIPYKKVLDTMQPYKPGKPIEETKKEYGLTEVIKLASNENPYGYSPKVAEWLRSEQQLLQLYPDANATTLKETLASKNGVTPEQLIIGNGSDELISIISRSMLDETKHVLMATPTFPQYVHNAKVEGASFTEIPLKDGHHDYEKFLQAIQDNTSIVWICNPNNPTGNVLNSAELQAFIEEVPSDILIVLDEAYFEYIMAEDHVDSLEWLPKYDNILILRTFSKAYGLASIRVGYGIGHPRMIEQFNKVRNPFNNNTMAHTIAKIAVEDEEFLQKSRQLNAEQRERFYTFAKEQGLNIYPSETNFVLIETKRDANELADELMKRGVIVRSGNLLGTPGYMRVTIGTEQQNDQFFEAFKQLL